MPSRPQGSPWFQNLLLLAFIAALVFGAKPVYRIFQAQQADRACLAEAEAYAQKMRRAFQLKVPASSPPNAACRSITDVSAGGSLTSVISATARAPGSARYHCRIDVGAHCVEA